jgi:hypothetical protein
VLFTLLVGGLNLLCQLVIRWSSELLLDPFGQPDRGAMAIQLLAWLGYVVTNLWLLVGLLVGADRNLRGERPALSELLRSQPSALLRAAGTLALVLFVLAMIARLAQASAWLLALLQPVPVGTGTLIIVPAGTVHAIDDEHQIWVTTDIDVIKDYDDLGAPIYTDKVLFDREMKPCLQLAYGLTVHKSQGSQYRNVIFIALERDSWSLLDRSLIYTAVTRAKSHCIVIGQANALRNGIKTVKQKTTILQELARKQV